MPSAIRWFDRWSASPTTSAEASPRLGSISEIIEAGDRSRVVTVAPPHGLTLWEVGYRPARPASI